MKKFPPYSMTRTRAAVVAVLFVLLFLASFLGVRLLRADLAGMTGGGSFLAATTSGGADLILLLNPALPSSIPLSGTIDVVAIIQNAGPRDGAGALYVTIPAGWYLPPSMCTKIGGNASVGIYRCGPSTTIPAGSSRATALLLRAQGPLQCDRGYTLQFRAQPLSQADPSSANNNVTRSVRVTCGRSSSSSSAAAQTAVTLTAPRTGDVFLTGGTQTATWTTTGFTSSAKVSLYLLDSALVRTTVASNIDNTGSYSWTTPTAAGTYKMSVNVAETGRGNSTYTSGSFAVNQPSNPCGNGRVETNEACDDGNTAVGDGCSSTCVVESGWTCSGTPSVCLPVVDLFLGAVDGLPASTVERGQPVTYRYTVRNNGTQPVQNVILSHILSPEQGVPDIAASFVNAQGASCTVQQSVPSIRHVLCNVGTMRSLEQKTITLIFGAPVNDPCTATQLLGVTTVYPGGRADANSSTNRVTSAVNLRCPNPCGNGRIDAGEECDTGSTPDTLCDNTCHFTPAARAFRAFDTDGDNAITSEEAVSGLMALGATWNQSIGQVGFNAAFDVDVSGSVGSGDWSFITVVLGQLPANVKSSVSAFQVFDADHNFYVASDEAVQGLMALGATWHKSVGEDGFNAAFDVDGNGTIGSGDWSFISLVVSLLPGDVKASVRAFTALDPDGNFAPTCRQSLGRIAEYVGIFAGDDHRDWDSFRKFDVNDDGRVDHIDYPPLNDVLMILCK